MTDQDRSALEIGIGEGGLISLSLLRFAVHRGQKLSITGVDCCAERVERSRLVANANNLPVDFLVGEMFSEISLEKKFDLIFFNPPYVPTGVGQEMRMDERFSQHGSRVWDGGADGTTVLSEFLQKAPQYLSPRGRVVFGLQEVFVPTRLVEELLQRQKMRRLLRRQYWVPPSVCYVVEPQKRGDC
jgi:methylase of polypeptide subunit release factors